MSRPQATDHRQATGEGESPGPNHHRLQGHAHQLGPGTGGSCQVQDPISGGESPGVVGAGLGPPPVPTGGAVWGGKESLWGSLSWGTRGRPPLGLGGPAGRRSKSEAPRLDRKEASVMMAAVSAIQPRSPPAAAATEAATAPRVLGAAGPGAPPAPVKPGPRARGWPAGSGAAAGVSELLFRSSGSTVGVPGPSGGVCSSISWMRICCRMAGSS